MHPLRTVMRMLRLKDTFRWHGRCMSQLPLLLPLLQVVLEVLEFLRSLCMAHVGLTNLTK